MDKIFLHGMKADTLIGVYDWERQHKQTLILDLDVVLPENSHQDDNIEHTIHYGEMCQLIRQELADCDFKLLESLAEFVAQLVFEHYPTPQLRLRVSKAGVLPDVREVGIEIERYRA
ncbi:MULTISPECIES: dihydroneopterin aldolase [Kingella]|jgi:dihydroneopterin aldolase|uniref:7,8-dihydroneopterin aldolase n=1 Tax=Kingella bonacorsii TaxID=2796361 RepID=A0ABS1BSJ9_9NEIS|nr:MULTISPECIES: dihydroneopterin aldolase [Kingella]MBK0395860.1 dihydroneopterin aldolase [Kingella bonacorsii]